MLSFRALNNHERSSEQNRNMMNKLVNNLGSGSEDDAIVLDDAASFNHEESLGLELIHEESDAPLLPPRVYSTDNHQPHHYSRRRFPQDHSESFFPLQMTTMLTVLSSTTGVTSHNSA